MSFTTSNPPTHKGQTDVWLTPMHIVCSFGKFDLDPCAAQGWPTANEHFYEHDNGLLQDWNGRVWLNPPYSQVEKWMQKFCSHKNGVALVFARTDTKWFHQAIKQVDWCFFFERRIKFLTIGKEVKGTANAPSIAMGFGDIPTAFKLEGVFMEMAK